MVAKIPNLVEDKTSLGKSWGYLFLSGKLQIQGTKARSFDRLSVQVAISQAIDKFFTRFS